MKKWFRTILLIFFNLTAVLLLKCQKTLASSTARQTGINIRTLLRGQDYTVMGIIFCLAVAVLLIDYVYFS